MLPVMFMDRDDPNPGLPWASSLGVAELTELVRPGKDGWMGPVPPIGRDPQNTLSDGGFSPFRWDGAIDNWRKTVVAFSNDRIYIMQRDDHTLIPRLVNYTRRLRS